MDQPRVVSLDRLGPGAHGVLRHLGGGKDFASRLAALGLSLGTEVEVLQNPGHGPMLVRMRGTRIALGRGEALKIRVEELTHGRR
jgi:ferrous iron transport protein A